MHVEFARDAAHLSDFPADALPEVALLGRSNAGKSSLLNALVGRKGLARTSAAPGKTRRIHFYRVAGAFYLVDLPGYGYAAVSKSERGSWSPMVEGYLGAGRPELRGALLLMDVRRPVSDEERELVRWLTAKGVPVHVALSKADKLSARAQAQAVSEAARQLALPAQAVAAVSARTGRGMAGVVRWVHGWSGVELRRPDGTAFAG